MGTQAERVQDIVQLELKSAAAQSTAQHGSHCAVGSRVGSELSSLDNEYKWYLLISNVSLAYKQVLVQTSRWLWKPRSAVHFRSRGLCYSRGRYVCVMCLTSWHRASCEWAYIPWFSRLLLHPVPKPLSGHENQSGRIGSWVDRGLEGCWPFVFIMG